MKKDGERTSSIRAIVTRAKQNLPTIEKDLAKLRELLKGYDKAIMTTRRR